MGIRCNPTPFTHLSIVAGPMILADGDGNHSSLTPGPVVILADGNGHDVLWMTPIDDVVVCREWPPGLVLRPDGHHALGADF